MKFLKENIAIILIVIVGIILRLNNDIFIRGCNYDEMAILTIAKLQFPTEIIKQIATLDYHAPLYYILIHPIANFENSTVYIRLLNLFLQILNIIAFYKIGIKLNNKSAGIFCALLLCVNHLAITTVSFIKFYAFCIFLFSLTIYFLIKIIKENNGQIGYLISSFLFILSSTFGFVVIFFEIAMLFKLKKECKKPILCALAGFLTYLPILLIQTKNSFTNVVSAHLTHAGFSLMGLYDFINDYFSPLVNYCNNIQTIEARGVLYQFISGSESKFTDILNLTVFVLFSLFSCIIGGYLIYKAVKSDKTAKNLFCVAVLCLASFSVLSLLDIVGFIPIYDYAAGIILLILAGVGASYIPQQKLKYFFIVYIIVCQLLIPNYYPIEKRGAERAKIFSCFEDYMKTVKPDTTVIATWGGRFYAKNYKNIYSFDYDESGGNFSNKVFTLLFGEETLKKNNRKNINKIIEPLIKNNVNKSFDDYISKDLSKIKSDKIILAYNCQTEPFLISQNEISKILDNKNYNYHMHNSTLKYSLKDTDEITQYEIFKVLQTYSSEKFIDLLDKKYKRTKLEQYTLMSDGNFQKTFEGNINNISTKELARKTVGGWVFVTYQKQ